MGWLFQFYFFFWLSISELNINKINETSNFQKEASDAIIKISWVINLVNYRGFNLKWSIKCTHKSSKFLGSLTFSSVPPKSLSCLTLLSTPHNFHQKSIIIGRFLTLTIPTAFSEMSSIHICLQNYWLRTSRTSNFPYFSYPFGSFPDSNSEKNYNSPAQVS